jgi:hypothetical protein
MKLVKKYYLPQFIQENLAENYNEEISEDAIRVGKYIEEQIAQIKLKVHLLKSVENKESNNFIFSSILPKHLLIAQNKVENIIPNNSLEILKKKSQVNLNVEKSNIDFRIIQSPSNSVNTIKKFYIPEIELIKKLNYYNPQLSYNDNEIIHLNQAFKDVIIEANTKTRLEKHKEISKQNKVYTGNDLIYSQDNSMKKRYNKKGKFSTEKNTDTGFRIILNNNFNSFSVPNIPNSTTNYNNEGIMPALNMKITNNKIKLAKEKFNNYLPSICQNYKQEEEDDSFSNSSSSKFIIDIF